MGKTRDLFKKIRDINGTFHAKMGSIKDRNGMDLTEAELSPGRGVGGLKNTALFSPGSSKRRHMNRGTTHQMHERVPPRRQAISWALIGL